MQPSAFGVSRLGRTVTGGMFWILIYSIGYFRMDWHWIIVTLGAWYCMNLFWKMPKKDSKTAKKHSKVLSTDLPAWVVHPDMQRAEWVNVVLAQLWPYLETLLRNTLQNIEDDQRLKERLQGYHIKTLRFPNANLGKIPPRLSGIKFHEATHRDEAILDLSLEYAGDLSILMEATLINEHVPAVKASLSNITLTSTHVRVHLRPLLADLPFVGAMTISFLDTPHLDFDLGGLANAFDVPGISLLLRHIIQDQLEQAMVLPNSMTISLIPENELDEIIRKKNDKRGNVVSLPSGVLTVNVIEAKGLAGKDISMIGSRKSDPFTTLSLEADHAKHSFRTDTIAKTVDPKWEMMVDLPVDDPESLTDLQLEVWDEDIIGGNDFLGRCKIPLQMLKKAVHSYGEVQDIWKFLEDTKKGSIHVSVGWSELKLKPSDEMGYSTSDKPLHKGCLSIFVDSCRDLFGGRSGLKLPNPKVKVEVSNVIQFTDTVIGNIDPVFEHRMSFLVNDPRSDIIKIHIMDDRRNDEIIGFLKLPISDILSRSQLSISQTVFDLECKSSFASNPPATITVSMAFRYIYRPKTNSYGSHHSLQDLPKIVANNRVVSSVAAMASTTSSAPSMRPLGQQQQPQLLETDLDHCTMTATTVSSSTTTTIAAAAFNGLGGQFPMKAHKRGLSSPDALNGDVVSSPPISPPKVTSTPNFNSPELLDEGEVNYLINGGGGGGGGQRGRASRPTPQPMDRSQTLPSAMHNNGNTANNNNNNNPVMSPARRSRSTGAAKEVGMSTNAAKIQLTLKYNQKNATLSVVVHRIRNLHSPCLSTNNTASSKDSCLPANAYVKLRLIENILPGRSHRVNNTKRRTPTQKNNLNPIFEETIHYMVLPHELKIRRLEVSVCHDGGRLGKNEVLSRFIVSLDQVQLHVLKGDLHPTITDWYTLPPDVNRSMTLLTS